MSKKGGFNDGVDPSAEKNVRFLKLGEPGKCKDQVEVGSVT